MPAFEQRSVGEESFDVRFDDYALGPFRSVFGGLLAGLAVDFARKDAHGEHPLIASVTAEFHRPVVSASPAVRFSAATAKAGRRTTVASMAITQSDKVAAIVNVTWVEVIPTPSLPKNVKSTRRHATDCSSPERASPFPGAWFGNLLDYRLDDQEGIHWFRRMDDTGLALSKAAFAIAVTDFASGISRPDRWANPVVAAFPNATLSFALSREPVGVWIGLIAPRSSWSDVCLGVASAQIVDEATLQLNTLIPLVR